MRACEQESRSSRRNSNKTPKR